MKKALRILLKITLIFIALSVVVFGILYAVYNEPLPSGQTGQEAEALAQKMLTAINNKAFVSTRYLEWSFAGGAHQYQWDKEKNEVRIEWDDYQALLYLKTPRKNTIFQNDIEVVGESKSKLIEKAISYFNNASFWLVAPFKVFDKGTERALVKMEDGSNGLLVTYKIGGTTPGDSYLWRLGPTGFPESYRMWVEIFPIGGLMATWDDWQLMESGVVLPTSHKLGPIKFEMGEVRGYN